MSINGSSVKLTKSQVSAIKRKLSKQRIVGEYLSEKGIQYQTLRRPLATGVVSYKVYLQLLQAELI